MNLHIKVHRWNKWAHVGGKRQPLPFLLSFLKSFFFFSFYIFVFDTTPISSFKRLAQLFFFFFSSSAQWSTPSLNTCRLSPTSHTQHCRGWWSVLSPSPPRWSNWKRKVPPLWMHVQGALSVCQATCNEQLINNYCFFVLPEGQGYNLQQDGGVKWVWSINYCWNTVPVSV